MKSLSVVAVSMVVGLSLSCGSPDVSAAKEKTIIHDADYYVLEAQHKDELAQDNNTVDQKLA